MGTLPGAILAKSKVGHLMRFAVVALLLLTSGCAWTEYSSAERKRIQGRIYEKVSYDAVFHAAIAILEQEGYLLRARDLREGIIVANIQKTERRGVFWKTLGGRAQLKSREQVELTFNLYRLRDGRVMTRISVQESQPYSLGGHVGHEIVEPQGYASFYGQLTSEIYKQNNPAPISPTDGKRNPSSAPAKRKS